MLVMLRIGPSLWLEDESLATLFSYLQRHPGTVDELAFFTHHTHAPLPLAELRRRFERLEAVMASARSELGVAAGINVLATMGHHDENLDFSLDEQWQRVVDPDGRICRGCYCPADPDFQGYVGLLYSMAARSQPDFIWVDDDVRLMGHMPIRATCFCDKCIRDFCKEVGRDLTRQSLMEGLDDPRGLGLRRTWLEHNRRTLDNLFKIIEEATHNTSPDIPIGFMTGDRFYEGYSFGRWARTLAGGRETEVRWRPGGGFYWDDKLLGLVEKAHDIGRQVSALPEDVNVIQSEVENFPYQRLKKSVRTTMIEAVAHMAAGATGLAFNVLTMYPEPLGEYEPFIDAIASARPFFQALNRRLGRSPPQGIFPAWNEDMFAGNGSEGSWFEGRSVYDDLRRQYVLGEIGLPMCYGSEGASVTTLSGATARSFSEGDLRKILGGSTFLDVGSWHTLDEKGLADLTGVRPGHPSTHDAIEHLSDDPINGAYSSRQRDCRQSFWCEPAYPLEPLTEDTRILAEIRDYGGRRLGPCLSAYENELGGRVVVSGYYPWSLIHNESKSGQLKGVFTWLSNGRLPAMVESFSKAVIWARGSPDPSLVVINASLDSVQQVRLRVLTTLAEHEHASLDGESTILNAEASPEMASGYRRITLEDIGPWSAHLITPT